MYSIEEIKTKLSNKIIGIAGCGGLGSNVATSLVRTGIKNLIIADFDKIEESNLNRQYFFYHQIGKLKTLALKENLLKINKKLNIITIEKKLTPSSILKHFQNCDLIIEAFDKADQKQMIAQTVLTHFPQKYLIMGSGIAGLNNIEKLKITQKGKLIICGDQIQEISTQNPPLAPKVAIIANMQANTAIKILLT